MLGAALILLFAELDVNFFFYCYDSFIDKFIDPNSLFFASNNARQNYIEWSPMTTYFNIKVLQNESEVPINVSIKELL